MAKHPPTAAFKKFYNKKYMTPDKYYSVIASIKSHL